METTIVTNALEKETATRLERLGASYTRRLHRLDACVARAADDETQLSEALGGALERETDLKRQVEGEVEASALVHLRSREVFERARVEHMAKVQSIHEDLLPEFVKAREDHDALLSSLREIRDIFEWVRVSVRVTSCGCAPTLTHSNPPRLT